LIESEAAAAAAAEDDEDEDADDGVAGMAARGVRALTEKAADDWGQ